jgi:uncharacterized protein YukE
MPIWGADVDQLRELGNKLNTGANEIDSQRNLLNSALDNTQWEGPDADRFKEQWRGEHTSKLKQISEALRDAGNRAKQNAEQQSDTSHG